MPKDTPCPKWPFVSGLLLFLASIVFFIWSLHHGGEGEDLRCGAGNSNEILSYIYDRNADPACNACIEAAKRDIEKKRLEAEKRKVKNMSLIPAGKYLIGSPEGEGNPDEWPRHKVYLDAFYIDKYEVTNVEYLKFARTVSANHPEWMKPGSRFNIRTGSDPYYKKLGKALKSDNNPVVGITWNDANAYCLWRQKRLPTEAEWETAARGGTDTTYHFGNDAAAAREYSWHKLNSMDMPHPVGSKKPNQYGIYDMQGNVWEWVADFYDRNYYSNSPKSNPKGPETGKEKVIRGGSWTFEMKAGRPANRASYTARKANDDIGFRCAVSRVKIRKASVNLPIDNY